MSALHISTLRGHRWLCTFGKGKALLSEALEEYLGEKKADRHDKDMISASPLTPQLNTFTAQNEPHLLGLKNQSKQDQTTRQ